MKTAVHCSHLLKSNETNVAVKATVLREPFRGEVVATQHRASAAEVQAVARVLQLLFAWNWNHVVAVVFKVCAELHL